MHAVPTGFAIEGGGGENGQWYNHRIRCKACVCVCLLLYINFCCKHCICNMEETIMFELYSEYYCYKRKYGIEVL